MSQIQESKSIAGLSHTSRNLLAYAGAVACCLLILCWSLRLWRADLSVPLAYSGDSLFMQHLVKGLIENGWYMHNDSLSAPGSLDAHDFPMTDGLHFVLLKALACPRP